MKVLKDLKIDDTVYSINDYKLEIRELKITALSRTFPFLSINSSIYGEKYNYWGFYEDKTIIRESGYKSDMYDIYFNKSEAIEQLKKVISNKINRLQKKLTQDTQSCYLSSTN